MTSYEGVLNLKRECCGNRTRLPFRGSYHHRGVSVRPASIGCIQISCDSALHQVSREIQALNIHVLLSQLAGEAVSPTEFKNRLESVCGLTDIHDYYGMVEQTGAIYMQCECGHLHASNFSDVLIRRGSDFSLCGSGERGIVQVVSVLPYSYPGHSLLTQDEGTVLGEDDCPCGRKGKYFVIHGRLKNAEVRGCSDTFERK